MKKIEKCVANLKVFRVFIFIQDFILFIFQFFNFKEKKKNFKHEKEDS